MLPTHHDASGGVHQRSAAQALSSELGHAAHHLGRDLSRSFDFVRHGAVGASGGGGGPSRRRMITWLVRLGVAACVLWPLRLLTTARMTDTPARLDSILGNRRMLEQPDIERPAAHLTNLVLVAGHAVYTGVDFHEASKESSWFLEEYQKVPGEAQSFVDHIELGIREAEADPSALLLFSGGQTRRAAGPRSEGLSYWVVAEAANWFDSRGVRERTFTEEHARDSFENLLFGLCRYYELTGHFPENIVVVSYLLKKERFLTLHREALRFPLDRFSFVGTPVPPDAIGAEEGEARTVAAFREDPYGCKGDLLAKKLRRDPFAVGPIHPSRCPDLRKLLNFCSPKLFEGNLPWL